MPTFAISIGAFALTNFVELNVVMCKKVFPDAPILISDGRSPQSEKMEEIAARHDCWYIGEKINRGHFHGDCANTVNGLGFAREMGADILLKINQRIIICHEFVRQMVESVFAHPHIAVALPGRLDPHQLRTPQQKWYSTFPVVCDCIFMRVSEVDPQEWIDAYQQQWKSNPERHQSYLEIYWLNLLNSKFKNRYAMLHCLSRHDVRWPTCFLRKTMNTGADFWALARDNGLGHLRNFDCREWREIRGSNYMPLPRV